MSCTGWFIKTVKTLSDLLGNTFYAKILYKHKSYLYSTAELQRNKFFILKLLGFLFTKKSIY